MTIVLLLAIAALCFAWVRTDIKRKAAEKDRDLARRLLRREIVEHMDARQENHILRGQNDDLEFTINMLIEEQTRELRAAHVCLEMVLAEEARAA